MCVRQTTLALLGRQFSGFLTVGLVNSGLTYLIYLALNWIAPYPVAYSLSYAVGVAISYLANATFVFDAPLSWRRAIRFAIVQLAVFSVSLLILLLLIEHARVANWLAPLLVVTIVAPVNFVLSRGTSKFRRD